MPIIVCLKEPGINLVCAGDIKDETSKEYDELFRNLMVKDQDGHNIVIPLSVECNIAFIKEVTQEELDKRKAEAEARRKKAPDGGGVITKPQFVIPHGRGGGRGN